MTLNIYYKKDKEEISKVCTSDNGYIYTDFIMQYKYLTSIKAEFKLSIHDESGACLVKISRYNNIDMFAVDNNLLPYHKTHYIQQHTLNSCY